MADTPVILTPPASTNPALRQIETLARWMDSKFKIPGTNFRFGLDGIIGLIPGAGDMTTFAVSSYMLWIMAQNGASGYVMARMVLNVLLDAIVGAIPILGDLFDFAFKANMRNMRLMQQHYKEGRHRGSAWKVILPVLIVLFIILVAIIWGAYKLLDWLFTSLF